MGNLIIIFSILFAALPIPISIILMRKYGEARWKWILSGIFDFFFLMMVIVDPSVETVITFVGAVASELLGWYMESLKRNGYIWAIATAVTFFIIFTIITEPELMISRVPFISLKMSASLFNALLLETWTGALVTSFAAGEKGKKPVIWFMIGIVLLGLPGLLFLYLEREK